MRPKAIILFERVLLAALAIDLVNNLLSWDVIRDRLSEPMAPASPILVTIVACAPTLIGLLFWYFIARRRSRVAKWLMTIFIAIGVAGFVAILLRTGDITPMVMLAMVSEAMKVFAVSRLFTREANAWFQGTPEAGS